MDELAKFIKEYQEKTFKQRLKEDNVEEKEIKKFENFCKVKAASIDTINRTVEVVASKEVVDRYGDIVKISGIDVNAYLKNPVVPWAHNYGGLPVAKAVAISITGDEIIIKMQFPTKEVYEFADTVFKLFTQGYLSAVSIGFIPIKEAFDSELKANVIEKSELLEVSVVPVPANPEALAKVYSEVVKSGEKKEVIKKETEKYNKIVLKRYRKYQVLLRDILEIEATDDEIETLDDIMKTALGILRFVDVAVKKQLIEPKANPKSSKNKPRQEATRPVKAKKSLTSTALKVASRL